MFGNFNDGNILHFVQLSIANTELHLISDFTDPIQTELLGVLMAKLGVPVSVIKSLIQYLEAPTYLVS